jgi:hypothetical protein
MLLFMGFVSVSGFGTNSHAPHHGRRGKGGLAARGENGRARLHPCGGGRACGNGASRFSIIFSFGCRYFLDAPIITRPKTLGGARSSPFDPS